MSFFIGDLVVSVCGCSLDEVGGSLVDPCVELSVGNKLHSTSLPVGTSSDAGASNGDGGKPVEFHGVSERDALTVTVLDRADPSNEDQDEAFVDTLLCTEWGFGGRPVRRSCVIVAASAQEQPSWKCNGSVIGRTGGESGSRVSTEAKGFVGRDGRKLSAVQLSIRWSPKVRLRTPLSLVADAGKRTRELLSGKIDRPILAALNLILDLIGHASSLHPGWKRAAIAASVASVSLGSACLAAIAALFLPCTLALAAAAATLAPPATAIAWVLACTAPVCDHLWRPLLVWAGTRSAVARGLLLLPAVSVEGGSEGVEQGGGEVGGRGLVTGERFGGGGGSGEGTVEQGGWTESASSSVVTMARSQNQRDGPDVIGSAAAGVILLLTCYQNLIEILHSGLEASRWRPRPRPRPR